MAFHLDAAVDVPFRVQPGLRRLAAGTPQLTPNRIGDRALREKLAVLSCFADEALVHEPGFDARPALDALIDQAQREHPQALSVDRHVDAGLHDGRLCAGLIGWSLHGDKPEPLDDGAPRAPEIGACLARLPPQWRRCALLCLAFAEDFAVLDGQTGRISWLAVCLPSLWSPREKVGRRFADVHAPVADNQLLLSAADHLVRLVTGGQRWERFVWTITPHPRLHALARHVDPTSWPAEADADPAQLAAQAFFRTERQTFIPVPGSMQAVFTIRVDVNPLSRVVQTAADARRLHDALSSMTPAVLAYRALTVAQGRLLAWLGTQAAVGPVEASSDNPCADVPTNTNVSFRHL